MLSCHILPSFFQRVVSCRVVSFFVMSYHLLNHVSSSLRLKLSSYVQGLSSIYINGALIKQTKQKKGQKLVQDWLVNGIGRSFGDDSMHYVDELYVFNRALKPVEVQALYDKCTFNRMVIHYGFQKGNNTLMLDQSGLQNDAIPIGGKDESILTIWHTDITLV